MSDGVISPVVDRVDPEFAFIRLEDMEIVATLGMGGFGRVELVCIVVDQGNKQWPTLDNTSLLNLAGRKVAHCL